tara:strand:- start:91 stop:540 length:450 start_codon:yes stop_codon:yes gene_type:complete
MKQDMVTKLLKEVASGKVSIKDAREALEGTSLDEETYQSAVDHGVFNEVEPGSIVRASLAPSGSSALVLLSFVWGLGWTLYWAGSMTYGLFNGWDQQQLAYHMAMTFVTLIIMGIIYLKWVMPDVVIVKHRRNKFIGPKDSEGWYQYEV